MKATHEAFSSRSESIRFLGSLVIFAELRVEGVLLVCRYLNSELR